MLEPAVADGDVITHDSRSLLVRGEVEGEQSVGEVTVNGQVCSVGSRDLVVEGFAVQTTPFRGTVLLESGANEVVVRAGAASLRFNVQVEAEALRGEAYALIVGVNDYKDPRITDLRYAEADAQAMREALTHPQYGLVPDKNVVVLSGAQATYRNISTALEDHLVRQANRPQDVVFFYFAGHGAEGAHISRGAAYYLVPHDAQLSNLLSTAIDKGRLQFLWGAVGARRKILITDACHSGGLQDMKVLSADGFETMEGYINLAAARADQLSWELPSLGHGIFTYCLTEGLKGGADQQGGDGFVSATELGDYLRQEMGRLAGEVGALQNPVVDLAPGAGQVLLATSAGKTPPVWEPPPPTGAQPFAGRVQVTMRFDRRRDLPHLVAALRDEQGERTLEQVATTALIGAFMEGGGVHFVEAGAVQDALSAEQAALAYSDNPGDIAAVARAVAADLMITGQFKSEATGLADADMAELLGTSVQSFQAHISARAVYANSGEIVAALNVQSAAAHINPTIARRKALEKAAQKLAVQMRSALLKRWAQLQGQRPGGLLTAENIDDYRLLNALEEALGGLAPAVNECRWSSYEGSTAVFEFAAGARAKETMALLKEKGLSGFSVGKLVEGGGTLRFWLKPEN